MPPSKTTMKRIQREISDLKKEDLGPIILQPDEENMTLWKGSIPGPEGSIYEGGVFNVEITLPTDYPFSAPRVMFKTKIYHMNISEQGNICIDILKHNWSPALSIFKVMLSLSSLLTDPNPKDPLVPSISQQYSRNRKQHDATARQWTKQFAMPKPPPTADTQVSATAQSSKAKGKKRADPQPSIIAGTEAGSSQSAVAPPRPSASTAAPVASDTVIVLDSDDESETRRTASASSRPQKRKRNERKASPIRTGEVLELLDSDEEEQVAKKTRHSKSQSLTDASSGGTSSRRPVTQPGEVIVID